MRTNFSLNQVTLIGRVGKDPDIKTVADKTVMSFSLATTYSVKKDGEYENKTDWHNISIWDASDYIVKNIRKGQNLSITGSIRYDKYEKDGKTSYFTKIMADNVILLGKQEAQETSYTKEDNEDLPFWTDTFAFQR